MSDGLIGIERDVVLNTLIQDKSPIIISPVVKPGVSVEQMTLQSSEYKIYPQGILFFKRFIPQWKPIDDLLRSNVKANIRLTVSFYHRGRGIFFISNLNLVQNGYALPLPAQVHKMDESPLESKNEVTATLFFEGASGIYVRCIQAKGFRLFDNKLWLNFSKRDSEKSKSLLQSIALLEEISPKEYTQELLSKTKLIMYLPDKKLPEKNHFPFSMSITRNNREILSTEKLEEEIGECKHSVLIPLCESPRKEVHTIVGLIPNKKNVTPSDVMDTLLLLPVCSYLSQENKKTFFSHQTNFLHIICITESQIILGSFFEKRSLIPPLGKINDQVFPLAMGQKYILKLHIPIEKMHRTILVTISVSKIYNNENKASCALCSFINLQEEDRRFLYEKYNKAKLR